MVLASTFFFFFLPFSVLLSAASRGLGHVHTPHPHPRFMI